LNPHVKVNVIAKLSPKDMQDYKCAVFTENFFGIKSLMEFNESARANGCGFILAETPGVAGYAFVDFGDNHVMFDKDGENTKQYIVTSINKNDKNEPVVTVHEDKRH
jgi:ubiquitin-activating enzyme E1